MINGTINFVAFSEIFFFSVIILFVTNSFISKSRISLLVNGIKIRNKPPAYLRIEKKSTDLRNLFFSTFSNYMLLKNNYRFIPF